MKKVFALLLVLVVVLANPMEVLAASKIEIPKAATSSTDNGDGTVTKVYSVTMKNDGDEATAEIEKAELSFTYKASAIKSFECVGNDTFTVTQETGTGSAACTFATDESSPATGASISVGTVKVVVDKDAKDEDCTIEYTYNGVSGKIVPNTGISMPYAIITGGIVIAAGLYFATKKKTKLQRI